MRSATYSAWLAALAASVGAQTFTECNPLSQQCAPDPALGRSVEIDLTQGAPDDFTNSGGGQPSYDSEGMRLSVAQRGDSPTVSSNWHIMFGHVEVEMQAAPGVGIVSSLVLQSDCLDEIDFEWLGGDGNQVQSNYFGKGLTTTYNRGAFHPNPGNHDGFHTYAVDWTADQIVWQIDGTTVRALSFADAPTGQYPQTPMMLRLGIWAGGDPGNAPGTIQWAGGPTDFSAGPYSMIVRSIRATDYSTGTEYTYGDSSGTWQSIRSTGGSISGTGNGEVAEAASSAAQDAPSITDPATGNPLPFDGTHRQDTSSVTRPSVFPWVPSESATNIGATAAVTSLPGLPSGWTISDSGRVVPPSSASSTSPPSSSTGSPSVSQGGSSSEEGSDNGQYSPENNEASITAAPVAPAAATTLSTVSGAPSSNSPNNGTVGATGSPSAPVQAGSASSFRLASGSSFLLGAVIGAMLL